MNTQFVNNRYLTLNWRIGAGLRQNLYADSLVLQDLGGTPEVEYIQVASFNQEGIESTVRAMVRLPGYIVYSTDAELFADFQAPDKPSIEWNNTLSLRLSEYLSLNYYANVDYLPLVTDTLQVEQSVLLRASWALL